MIEGEEEIAGEPQLLTDTTVVRAFGAFDYDDPITNIRWRGIPAKALGDCPTPTLLCDSISANKSKCGFRHDGSYWRRKTINGSGSGTGAGPSEGCSGSFSIQSDFTYNGDCSELTTVCSGGGSSVNLSGPTSTYSWATCSYTGSSSTDDWVAPIRCFDFVGPSGGSCPAGFFSDITDDCSETRSDGSGATASWSASVTYADEYTTADLISNTQDALPPYFGHFGCEENEIIGFRTEGQNCVCFASRNLSEDESSLTISRFKYIFQFDQPSGGYLKILWNEVFKPDIPGDGENSDPTSWTCTPQEYIFTCSPCDNTITEQSDEFEVMEPSDNGTIYILDIRWSIDPDYDPEGSVCDEIDDEQNCTRAP